MNWIKKMVRKYLEIEEPDNNRIIQVEAPTDYLEEIFINQVWYRGSGYELEQLYNQIKTISGNKHFWGSKNTRIRKIHTGLPSMIIDTLADIVVDNLSNIVVKDRQEEWDEIQEENNFKELVKKAIVDVLWGGDGAFKFSYDPRISKLPIIEFFSADRVEYEINRGRTEKFIFKTNKRVKNKVYVLHEIYSIDGVEFKLYDSEGREVDLSLLSTEYKPVLNKGKFIMAKKFLLRPSYKFEGRGKSMLSGKLDNFDAFDEVWSQWMLAIRKGQIKTYIPESLVPRDGMTGAILRANDFENDFISLNNSMGEDDKKNQIQTTQGNIQYEALLNTYVTALDQCLTGLISPSTLGIDTKKLDNAEAQREKEKTTLYKINQIIDVLKEVIQEVVNISLKVKDNLNKEPITETEVEVIFTSYANPSFEAQVETIGKANTSGIMSVETQVEQLWGDDKSKEWKEEEIARIKEERGVMNEIIPAINRDNIGFLE